MNKLVSKFCKASLVSMACIILAMMIPATAFASEADLKIPMVEPQYNLFDIGLGVCILGMIFGLCLFLRKRMK